MNHHGHSHDSPGSNMDDVDEEDSMPPLTQTPLIKAAPQLTSEQLGQMLLFFASAGDPYEVVKKLDEALKLGVDVNLADPFGNTLLHWASSRGCYELVVQLLEAGADVNKPNLATAHTPLHWGCPEGNVKVALTLIEHGAKLDVVDLVGREPLFYAVANEKEALVHLLLLKKAPIDSRDNGGTLSAEFSFLSHLFFRTGNSALHWAAKTGNLALTRMLLAVGFDANAQNNLGESPLHIAAKEDKCSAFQLLLRHGGGNIDIRNTQGQAVSEIAVGEVRTFLNTSYKDAPHHFTRHQPYSFKKSLQQAMITIFIHLIGAYLLNYLGWFLGIGLPLATFYAWSKSKYWPSPDDYSSFAVAMIHTAYFVNMYVWFTRIRPLDMESRPMENTLFTILSVSSFIVSQYLIWKAYEPGYVNTAPEDDAAAFFEDIRLGVLNFHLCPTCRIRKPLRSKHDAVSNRCVYRFDHFCQFLNQPIGQKNHHLFLLALLFTCIHYTFFVVVAYRHLLPFLPISEFLFNDQLLVYQFSQACAYSVVMNFLLFNQIYYAGTGYTTNEKIGQNTGKYIYLWRNGQRFSPFSRGSFIENLMDFFARIERFSSQFYLPGEVPLQNVAVERRI